MTVHKGGIKMHFLRFLRRVSPLFALAAVLSFLPAAASATLADGPCGPSATWSLSTQSSAPNVLALNISGTGAITSNPWLEIGESLGKSKSTSLESMPFCTASSKLMP